MLFFGYIPKTAVGTLVSEGGKANKVYQMLANYQKGLKMTAWLFAAHKSRF